MSRQQERFAAEQPASAYRKVFNPKTFQEELVETEEPEVFIMGDIEAQAMPDQIRPKKKIAIGRRDIEA